MSITFGRRPNNAHTESETRRERGKKTAAAVGTVANTGAKIVYGQATGTQVNIDVNRFNEDAHSLSVGIVKGGVGAVMMEGAFAALKSASVSKTASGLAQLEERAGESVMGREGAASIVGGTRRTLNFFSGTEKAWQTGATPNSIYTYLSKDGKAVSNYIYNNEGKVIYQVDFGKHGKFASGHGHEMTTPGNLGSGHTNHIPFDEVPQEYLKIPEGTEYSTPIGQLKK